MLDEIFNLLRLVALIHVMAMVMIEAAMLALVLGGERFQGVGPAQVLFPFNIHQDLRARNEKEGVVRSLVDEVSRLGAPLARGGRFAGWDFGGLLLSFLVARLSFCFALRESSFVYADVILRTGEHLRIRFHQGLDHKVGQSGGAESPFQS